MRKKEEPIGIEPEAPDAASLPPVDAEPAAPAPEPEKPGKPKKMPVSTFNRIVNTIFLILSMLVLGALIVIFALYLPRLGEFNKSKAELERLATVEAAYNTLQGDYARVSRQSAVYKTISDAGLLQGALETGENTKTNQQLRYVEEDLAKLELADFPEIQQRLQSQFLMVKANAAGNPQKALEELEKLNTDLLMLAANLK